MRFLCSTILALLLCAVPVHAQFSDSYLQFANHTNLLLHSEVRISGDAGMVTAGQPLIRPWQNPNYHNVGLYVEVVLLELLFDIYTKHRRDRWLARADRFSFTGDKDYTIEIDIKNGDDLIFTILYRFNDLPFNFINPTHYNVRYPDGTLDAEPWYASHNELGNNPHEASRLLEIDGAMYKLIYGTFYEDLDPTKDVIYSLSEADPVSFNMEPDPADLADPTVLNVLTYNPGILMPLTASDQEEDKRAAVFHKAMPKNMDFIIFQEFFDPVQSRRIMNNLEPYYPYRTNVLNYTDVLPGIIMGGGVAIMSKHPILEEDDFSFKNDGSANIDPFNNLANKGIKYARIDKHGQIIHVFGTHTHGYSSDNNDMGTWISERISPNRDDIVIMGGDMNTRAYDQKYHNMMDTMNAVEPTYLTLTHDKRQRGTIWKDNHFIAPSNVPPNTIDFLFANDQFKVPLVSYNDVQAYRLNSTDRNFWGIYDLGDHQPVYGRFEFPGISDEVSDTELCPGEDLELAVSTTLTDYAAAWYKDDAIIEGENGLLLSRPAIGQADYGHYRCELTYTYSPDAAINGGDPFTTGYIYPGPTTGKLVSEFEVVPDGAACRLSAEQYILDRARIAVYPNPASGRLTIKTNADGALISIYTAGGELILESAAAAGLLLDVSGWADGWYIARMSYGGQLLYSEKFMVQN
jgi:endonuclease/exonuclease/phosphatase family metal-dependent hydrolase